MAPGTLASSFSNLRIGVALGGGGARGLAHLGVLKVLEQAGIFPKVVAGTSMGAIIGALYCALGNAGLAEQQVLPQLQPDKLAQLGLDKFQSRESSDFFSRHWQKTVGQLARIYFLTTALTQTHVIDAEKVHILLTQLLPAGQIQDLPLAYAAVAADLLAGEPYVFKTGPITLAARASSAIPGVFPPVLYADKQLVDGAVVSLVPVAEAIALGADFVIAVDVSPFTPAKTPYQTGVDILFRSDQVTGKILRDNMLTRADAIIRVERLEYEWHAFHASREIIAAGEQAAREAVPAILAALQARQPWWRRWLHF